ncbi:DUF4145 domain-containing protein [Massilia sp. LXY-6]|uniref:DUF4145 domain-containing protein n=1 Tax=Massilia sp. LXY-6 TaxID=3379823 RepID=UPI003EE08F78
MPVNRKLYTSHITYDASPHYPCPRCGGGHYRLVKDSLKAQRTADVRAVEDEEWFDAEHDETRFVAILECDNARCKEAAVVAGKGWVEEWHDEYERHYTSIFLPYYILPSPRMISIPTKCPREVITELDHAFVASWHDFAAAGNHIRSATERVLDSLKVPKQILNVKRKRVPILLHNRIQKLEKTHPEVHDYLMAIKWLGNAASHSSALTRDDVFDALDIFETVLDKVYSTHTAKIRRLVNAVIANRGPAR